MTVQALVGQFVIGVTWRASLRAIAVRGNAHVTPALCPEVHARQNLFKSRYNYDLHKNFVHHKESEFWIKFRMEN